MLQLCCGTENSGLTQGTTMQILSQLKSNLITTAHTANGIPLRLFRFAKAYDVTRLKQCKHLGLNLRLTYASVNGSMPAQKRNEAALPDQRE